MFVSHAAWLLISSATRRSRFPGNCLTSFGSREACFHMSERVCVFRPPTHNRVQPLASPRGVGGWPIASSTNGGVGGVWRREGLGGTPAEDT